MKKLLILSDNPDFTMFFQDLILERDLQEAISVEYAYSCKNSNPANLIALGAKPIDLKDPATVDFIIKKYHFVFSLHCKQIFPARIVNNVECINLHPGLNPFNRGWYPQVFSIINKKPIGATLHYMDEDIDHGPIISQEEVSVYEWDTSLDVYNRVVEAEKRILRDSLEDILNGSALAYDVEFEGNYNSVSDFFSACRLQLNNKATMKDHIDILRALTHGDFKNAYYISDEGKKVFVRIELIVDE